MPPTVALDVTPLLTMRTGIGRSVEELLDALSALPDGPSVLPYALGTRSVRLRPDAPPGTRFVPLPVRAALEAWGRTDRPRVDRWLTGSDVLHATNFVVPPVRTPSVVTVHDCSFELFPETVNAVVARFGAVLRRALARGAVAHVTTEQVGREVRELFGASAEQVVVVPFGVPRLEPSSGEREPGPPYVLAIGRSEPRKNLPRLVEAFSAAFPTGDVRLVLAGPDGPDRPALDAAAARSDRVQVLGPVDEPARRRLLEGAAALAYPSLYEGFGFPVLEAMTLGVPVLAADLPVLREVSGGLARFADPRDVDALAAGLQEVLALDAADRGRVAGAGAARAATFTWERTARGLADLYARLATSS